MTRHRKGLPLLPLSQSGLIRVPANPHQRNFGEGGQKAKREVLDAFNEHAKDDRQIHATKGWRRLSVKRGRAQMLMAEMLHGQGRPLHLQRRFIVEGY